LPQLDPAGGLVNGALEALRIHESFHHDNRVCVTCLPILAQPVGHLAQDRGAEIGHAAGRQEQKAHVVRHQSQTAAALFIFPADPAITLTQMQRGGREDQHRQPFPPLRVA